MKVFRFGRAFGVTKEAKYRADRAGKMTDFSLECVLQSRKALQLIVRAAEQNTLCKCVDPCAEPTGDLLQLQ